MTEAKPAPDRAPLFRTTHWSLIADVRSLDPERRARSLNALCEAYWKPVYIYVRGKWNLSHEDAEDGTQGFFSFLLERGVIDQADRERARFRTYLKAVLTNFTIDQVRLARRLKRGGGHRHVSMDQNEDRDFRSEEFATAGSPEEALDRAWARALLDRARQRLREHLRDCGRSADWDLFADYLGGDGGSTGLTYEQLSGKYGLDHWAVWRVLSEVTEQLRSLMREEVSETVLDAADVEDELRTLSCLLT